MIPGYQGRYSDKDQKSGVHWQLGGHAVLQAAHSPVKLRLSLLAGLVVFLRHSRAGHDPWLAGQILI